MSEEIDEMMQHLDNDRAGPESYTFRSQDVSWDGDSMWFDCPFCGDRLCAAWFYSGGSCGECGANVQVSITVTK